MVRLFAALGLLIFSAIGAWAQPVVYGGGGAGSVTQGTSPWLTAPAATSPVALDASTVTTAGTAVAALTSGHHAKGGWLRNCNATGYLYVNDNGAAASSEGGSTTVLNPGLNGTGDLYSVPPGAATISVNASISGMAICGEGEN